MEVEEALCSSAPSPKNGRRYTSVMFDDKCLPSVIWTQAPKNQNASLLSVTRAVTEAVSVFNKGKTDESIAFGLSYTTGSCILRRSLEKDQKRLKKSTAAFFSHDANEMRLAKRHKADRSTGYSPGQL